MFARFVFRPVCLSLFHPVPLSLLICLSCLICAASLCLYSSSFSKVNTLCSPWLSHHHHLQHYHHHCFCSLLSLLKLLLLLLVSSEHRFFLFSLFLFFPLFIIHNNWPLFGQQQCLTAVEFQWGGEAKNRRTDWLTDWQTNTLHRRTERKVVSTDTAENSATRLKSPCSRHWRSQWLLSVCSTQVVGTTTHRANLGYFFPHSPLWRTLAYRHTHTLKCLPAKIRRRRRSRKQSSQAWNEGIEANERRPFLHFFFFFFSFSDGRHARRRRHLPPQRRRHTPKASWP